MALKTKTPEQVSRQRAAALRQQEVEKNSGVAALQASTVAPELLQEPVQKRATLVNDAGNKITTESGSQDAQRLFGMGYRLPGAPKTTSATTSSAQGTITSPSSSAISSTDDLRQEANATRTDAVNLNSQIDSLAPNVAADMETNNPYINSLLTSKAFSQTEEGQKMKSKIDDLYEKLGSSGYTDEEKAQIQADVDNVKRQYDELIAQAQYAKDQGMPKATIAAGQQGGFMNTQFSGLAALMQTQGGTFSGTGGELNRIQSEYDRNIQSLQSQQIQAMEAAKQAAQNAIDTGRKEDLSYAIEMYNQAKSMNDEVIALAGQKAEAVYQWQDQVMELNKYKRETATATLDALANSGKSADEIPSWYLEDLDTQAGYVAGTSKGLLEVAAKSKAQLDQAGQIELANSFATLMSNMEVGAPPVTIGDSTYSLLNYGDATTGTESSGTGQYLWTTNNATGETTVRKFGQPTKQEYVDFPSAEGPIRRVYADGTSFTFDPRQPGYGVPDPQALQASFPDGYKPTDAELAAIGLTQLGGKPEAGIQCGQYARYISGYDGPSLSEFSAKKALIDYSIGTEENPPQAGDAFIQAGGTWGHIGIVLGATKLEDGSYQIAITDANANGTGTVRYDTINSKNVLGFAREGFGLKPEFSFGSDGQQVADDGLTFGVADSEILSTTEAAALNVPYGTTKAEAAALGIVPGKKSSTTTSQAGSYVTPDGAQATLTAGQVDNLSGFAGTLDVIPEILALSEEVSTGAIGSLGQALKLGAKSEKRIELDGKLNLLQAEFQKAISGATVSEEEAKRLGKFLPSLGDSNKQIRVKLNTLQTEMERRQKALKQTLNVYQVIEVKDNATGQIGTIVENEFDPALYTKI